MALRRGREDSDGHIADALRYMTTKRIYELAYIGTLEIWKKESEFLGNEPDEVQEIRKLLIAENSIILRHMAKRSNENEQHD